MFVTRAWCADGCRLRLLVCIKKMTQGVVDGTHVREVYARISRGQQELGSSVCNFKQVM